MMSVDMAEKWPKPHFWLWERLIFLSLKIKTFIFFSLHGLPVGIMFSVSVYLCSSTTLWADGMTFDNVCPSSWAAVLKRSHTYTRSTALLTNSLFIDRHSVILESRPSRLTQTWLGLKLQQRKLNTRNCPLTKHLLNKRNSHLLWLKRYSFASVFRIRLIFMHLADAFFQSDSAFKVCSFYRFMHSLEIKPMTLSLLASCSTIWAAHMQI